MMKKIAHKLALLGCLSSCWVGLAQASTHIENADDDVIFGTLPDVTDIACTPGTPAPATRTFSFPLVNTEPSTFKLTQITLNGDTTPVDVVINASTSTCNLVPIPGSPTTFTGSIAGYSVCNIDVDITQPTCVSGPMKASIDTELLIKVSAQQPELITEINFDVTAIGSGVNFAAIASHVTNTGGVGIAQIFGNLAGLVTTPTPADFNVREGVIMGATQASIDANNDLAAGQAAFRAAQASQGCSLFDILVGPPVPTFLGVDLAPHITPGYYCLDVVLPFFLVPTVAGAITLDGPGDYVFFVNTAAATLQFALGEHFNFINGASKDNVYWITAGDVVLDAGFIAPLIGGAIVDGTVLADGTITATTAIVDTTPSLVQGRLWSASNSANAIHLRGNTVTVK